MGSVRTILASLFTALGGLFLVAMTVGVGFTLYLATAPDSISAPAEADADAVAATPLVRAQSTIRLDPTAIRVASTSFLPPDVSPPQQDRSARIRELQKALVHAGCYNGKINGVWTDASKDAMRGFVQTVNAKLPVDSPDAALIALMESNESATCSSGRGIETGSLGGAISAQATPAASQSTKSESQSHQTEQPTMLGRNWAPAGMLVPSESAPSPAPAAVASDRQPVAGEVTASNDIPATATDAQSPPPSAAHFEGGSPLPAVQPIDPEPDADAGPAESQPQKASSKSKKTKTARRRAAKYEDVETTISRGFDTLQRSISSMF